MIACEALASQVLDMTSTSIGGVCNFTYVAAVESVDAVCKAAFQLVQERLKNQKAEAASNPEYGQTYKPKVSKADKQAKRKQILSNIGKSAMRKATRRANFYKDAHDRCNITFATLQLQYTEHRLSKQKRQDYCLCTQLQQQCAGE